MLGDLIHILYCEFQLYEQIWLLVARILPTDLQCYYPVDKVEYYSRNEEPSRNQERHNIVQKFLIPLKVIWKIVHRFRWVTKLGIRKINAVLTCLNKVIYICLESILNISASTCFTASATLFIPDTFLKC